MKQLIFSFIVHHLVVSWLLIGAVVAEMCRRAAVKVCLADGTKMRGGLFAVVVFAVITIIWPMAISDWIRGAYVEISNRWRNLFVGRRTDSLEQHLAKVLDEQQCNGAG